MPAPTRPPNGRLDKFQAGSRSITIQTEFFASPAWRVETKVYLDGALKKCETVDLGGLPEEELQRRVDASHEKVRGELVAKVRGGAAE